MKQELPREKQSGGKLECSLPTKRVLGFWPHYGERSACSVAHMQWLFLLRQESAPLGECGYKVFAWFTGILKRFNFNQTFYAYNLNSPWYQRIKLQGAEAHMWEKWCVKKLYILLYQFLNSPFRRLVEKPKWWIYTMLRENNSQSRKIPAVFSSICMTTSPGTHASSPDIAAPQSSYSNFWQLVVWPFGGLSF